MNMRHLAAACTLLAAAPCLAAVQWTGDFESGNLNQWSGKQEVSTDRLQIVTDPVHQGKYALKVTVLQGDNPINASGNRNELFEEGRGTEEGAEAYYHWSTMFPADFPSEKGWQLFAQWHQPEDCCGSPPIQFYVYGEEVRFTVSTAETQVWTTPLVRGAWHDFTLHVRFSDDPKVGFVELWYDGQHVLPKTFAATRANDYLKMGLYRAANIAETGVLYQDGMVRGETLEDVMPPAPVATPDPGPGTPPAVQDSPPPPTTTPPVTSSKAPELASGGSSGAAAGGCSATGSAVPALALAMLAGSALLSRRRRQRAAVPSRRPR